MNNKAIEKEKRRLKGLLSEAEVPKQKRDALEVVINELAWQRLKLEETRTEIADASVVCEYRNGETQTGTHENPLFKGYNALFRSYMQGLNAYLSYLPKDLQEEAKTGAVDVLAQVKAMKKGTT